ncbi:GNAT family protein [Streptomyces sp. NPDC051940]|uniref:GNAT family N-acetyltransferase n=1 Tax=Streptomyces sp. NPDC051940 TaxID=3155675 RepID=UPI003433E158
MTIDAPVLEGARVRLEPLDQGHAADLAEAAADRSSFRFTPVPEPAGVRAYVDGHLRRAAAGQLAPYAQVLRATGRAVGVTSYCTPRWWPDGRGLHGVEIGWTWLGAAAQGTGVNAEAKLLLFRHAFGTLGVRRVDLMTDARNTRSRAAIEKLGARLEGVLRSYALSWVPGEEGTLRDSAMYAVTAAEWPACEALLVERLARYQ